MRLRTTQAQGVINWWIVSMAVAVAGCSQGTPTSPTSAAQLVPTDAAMVAAAFGSGSASARTGGAATVSWSCFTGDLVGFGSGCPAARFATFEVGSGQVVTTAPPNLRALVQGTTVRLEWGVPPGNQPTSYVIEAGRTPGARDIAVFDTGSPATGVTVTDVPPGTYYVRVRGRDASGPGPVSNEVTVVVTASSAGPCQPRDLSSVVIGSEIALGWEEPPGAGPQCGSNRYLIEVGSGPGLADIAQVSTVGLIPAFGASGVPSGVYYIRVRSQGPGGLSAPSNEVVVTVTGVVPPGTTRWVGLVANGDGGVAPDDDDCGLLMFDITGTFVQSGASVSGILTLTFRVAPNCPEFLGGSITETLVGTATGSLADGSGTIAFTTPTSSSALGTFANGRMTGSVNSDDGTATFAINRQ